VTSLHLAGRVIRPQDPEYERARRIWNGAIDRRPLLIATCVNATDVRTTLDFARQRDLPISVRGGGHNVAGTALCDGGVVIDLSDMKRIAIDAPRRTARVEPGVRWGELDSAAQMHGLATTGGIVTDTGIAGLTLGGGIGWLMRHHGLTCDNLLSAQVLTADGEIVTASHQDHEELLWALRGGGGNFGIVTEFEFALHPVGPTVLAGPIMHAAEDGPDVLRFYRDFASSGPEQLTTIVSLRTAPDLPWIPQALRGTPVILIIACWSGDVSKGEQAVKPLREFGPPVLDDIHLKPYTDHQSMFDATVPSGLGYYWKSHYLPPLSDGAIDAIAALAWSKSSPMSYTLLFHMGGMIRKLTDDDSAFSGRDSEHAININAMWSPGDEPVDIEWARDFWQAMWPHSTGGVYVNFLGDEGDDRVRAAYGGAKYDRLAALKAKYDPENLFRANQNIRPGLVHSP
jgi:FAD/FMN-containing dehydrogenase